MFEIMCVARYGAASGVSNSLIGKNVENSSPLLLQENDLLGIVGWIMMELAQKNDIKITWHDEGDDE